VGAEQVERMIESGVDLGDVFDVAEDTIKARRGRKSSKRTANV